MGKQDLTAWIAEANLCTDEERLFHILQSFANAEHTSKDGSKFIEVFDRRRRELLEKRNEKELGQATGYRRGQYRKW